MTESYQEKQERQAREAYAKHAHVSELHRNPYRAAWKLWQPDPNQCVFWTRIISEPPHLIVIGDGPSAITRGHKGDSPLGLVYWIAGQTDMHYLAGKCDDGMREPGGIDWDEVIGDLKSDSFSLAYIRDELAKTDSDEPEFAYSLGRVVSPRVYYARAACQALVRLLEARCDRDR